MIHIDFVPIFKGGDLPPPPHDYNGWHEWAETQYKAGLRQTQCAACHRWYFPQEIENHECEVYMLIIRVDEGEALPLARTGYCRVIVEEWNSHGVRHVLFVPADATPQMHRGYSDIVAVVNYIRQVAPGLAIRKVEML